MRILEGHTSDVMALAFAPDGRRLASAGWDGTVRVWDPFSGQVQRCIRTPNDHVLAVAYSPDGQRLAVGFRHDQGAGAFNRGFGTLAWFPAEPRIGADPNVISSADTWFAHDPGVTALAFFPSGKHLATQGVDSSESSSVYVWDLETRCSILTIGARKRRLQAM